MELRADRFERQLASEPLKPVYLIAGAEPLRVLEAADAVRAKAKAEGYGEREVFDVESGFDWNRLGQGMASLSLFASRRLFDLRLPTGKPGKDGSEALREYCESPPPDTVLLVTAHDWSRQHAGKWSEAIAAAGHFLPLWPLKVHELPDWLQQRLRSRGLVATPGAAQRLLDRIEGNLLAAAQEIDKLALNLGASAGGRLVTVDEATMDSMVADSARFDVFGLADAALAGDPVRAVRMLAGLRAEGEQVPGLLPIVARELLSLAALSRVNAAGGNLLAAMREARVWDSRQAQYKRAIERHPAERWEAFVAEAGRIDRSAKGRGDGDAWRAFERLLVAVASAPARRLLAS
jgi:DNA polymerase III subunit delta